jgi:cation:H+ antiporter
MRRLHQAAARAPARVGAIDPKPFRRAMAMFFAAALAIFLAAPEFARAAARLAEVTGLGDTFVGTALVGFATSLPELVASAAAVRAGAIDLAVGNLFGSNAVNMLVFFPLDLVEPGPIFGHVQQTHVVAGSVAVAMLVLALMTLSPAFRRNRFIGEASPAILVLGYFAGLWTLFLAVT